MQKISLKYIKGTEQIKYFIEPYSGSMEQNDNTVF